MTTTDILPFKDNKDFDPCYCLIKEIIELRHEVTSLRDQTDCMQKSVAGIRKDLSISKSDSSRNKDKSFWIHW
jgi:hypothetical protein